MSYITLFKIRFINGLQYRIAAWAGLATQFAWGFMNILLFHAFYSENPANFPMTFGQFAAYTWLNQAFLMMFAIWILNTDVFNNITSGNIAYELARPIDLYNKWLVDDMAYRLSRVVLRCFPVLIVSFLLPNPFGLTPPQDIFTFGLFILSIISAFVLVNLYCMYFYILGFYTINASGVRLVGCAVAELLSGFIIPLPFFPEPVLKVVNLLPFAAMQNTPYFIYSGYMGKDEALFKIGLQIFWITVFYITGKLMIKHAVKKVIVQGG